ncbi:MAG: TetR/AcrR family transcriptional regulator [Methyloprofundus sp.]|nr:TetR/AcrR family transcriptional regulator [Methyloprofundus sp.]MBW6452510.1 TetR/AcrR family transcriptional regulator [Methyloprofundus sp.]
MNTATRSRSVDTRQQILSIAKGLILGKGFSAVGLNEILKAAQVPKGSFYHYFDSKEHFGVALLESYFDAYLATLDVALHVNCETSALKCLLDYFDSWKNNQCNEITSDKCLVVKLSGEVSDLSEAMRLSLKQGTNRVINRLAQCVQQAVDNKEIVLSDDAETVTKELYYLWLGATLMTKVNHTTDAFEVAIKALHSRFNLTELNKS